MNLQNMKKGLVCGIKKETFGLDEYFQTQRLDGKVLFYRYGNIFEDHSRFDIIYKD